MRGLARTVYSQAGGTVVVERAEARRLFTGARVAVLATLNPSGQPHLVPITFVVDSDRVWTAVDGKSKRSTQLRRHANIRANPAVSLLAQHWDEDWSALWWVRADGIATITDTVASVDRVADLLRSKYDQYDSVDVSGPVVAVTIHTWRGWTAAPI
jgi:PPOX class probable F420-dependent enzyme